MFSVQGFCSDILIRLIGINDEQGAQTTIYCSVDEKIANESGLYYSYEKCSYIIQNYFYI